MDGQVTITQVKDLRPDLADINLLGIVLCKHSPKVFKDSRDQNSMRCVSSLTLRDQSGYVNCNIWGSEKFVKDLCSDFKIEDVVIISGAQLALKSVSDENFNPTTSSPYSLSIGEKQGGRVAVCENSCHDLRFLLHLPVRRHDDYYNLSEIFENGDNIEGQLVNILAVVKKMTQVQSVRTKNGKELEKMEITLFDHTSDAFTVVVWEPEYFSSIQEYTEKRTVLFAADVRLNYNKFTKRMQGAFTSKTICIRDPRTSEASQLYEYALEHANRLEEMFGDCDDIDFSTVDELKSFTVGEILAEAEKPYDTSARNSVLRGLTYAAVTSFNIDDLGRKPWCLRCSACKYRLLSDEDTKCRNEQCVSQDDPSQFSMIRSFDTQLSLSDHTGTIEQCRVSGAVVEKMIGISAESLDCLTNEHLTELKWSWLMERCKVRFRLNLDQRPVRPRIELCEKPGFEAAMSLIKSSTQGSL